MTTSPLSTLSDQELSVKARAGHVALLLGSLGMSTITGSLWLTEPGLPERTSIAFAALTAMGLCWAAYAVHVLRRRFRLLALQRVVAARIAFTFCTAATAGSLYLVVEEGIAAARPACAVFAVMSVVAGFLLARARRHYRALSVRKAELERQLGRPD